MKMDELIRETLGNMVREKKYNELYQWLRKEYYDNLLSFAESYLKSKELAEEVVLDVLYRIWRRGEAINKIEHVQCYLLASVRRACYQQLLKQKKERTLLIYTDQYIEAPIDVAADPEHLLLHGELTKLINQAVERLPPRCKEIYTLIREQGLRNKDVAVRLNISVNTIDVQLSIALRKIRDAISCYR